MPEKIVKPPQKLADLQTDLQRLDKEPGFEACISVVRSIIRLLGVPTDSDLELFNTQKIKTNAHWFMEAAGFADRRACYKIADGKDIGFKVYWVQKPSKRVISAIVALTPNFEDEPFNINEPIGIDFVIPAEANRVIIALSNKYIIRTLEISGPLSITQQEIFTKWLQPFNFTNKKQVHETLWQSFDLSPLNKRFYGGISEFFKELRQFLSDGKKVLDPKHASLFTNRLIGRVIFCWFLRKKGIISNEHGYFDVGTSKSTDYYRLKLETLFFGVLNTPIPDRGEDSDRKTPFLNGGLFEPKSGDLYRSIHLEFPEDFFQRFFEFLNRYNFTTDESTSSFQQVAIDPEMLGRIFENLLAEQTEESGEQARKAKGAFYTPREIVDYMCRESLRTYLGNKLPSDSKKLHILELLFDKKEHEFDYRNFREDLRPYKNIILEALDSLKILDPACGSGAFPMGMLQRILSIYERLEARFDPYKLKLDIIKNNIHGIDIEPMAVEISRLRAWLSIIVDEDVIGQGRENNGIDPLPNLDFKFVCANSLISLDREYGIFDDPETESKMQEIRSRYFKTESDKVKIKMRKEFDSLLNKINTLGVSKKQQQLLTYHPFDQDTSCVFFDGPFMFGVDKFDVIIGNPPYVRQELIKDLKPSLENYYECYDGKADLYVYFYERSVKLLADDGVLCFITSNKFYRAGYGKPLRRWLAEKTNIKIMADFGDAPVFTAVAYPTILLISKSSPKPTEKILALAWDQSDDPKDFALIFQRKAFEMERESLSAEAWQVVNNLDRQLMNKLLSLGKPLKAYVEDQLYYGIKTGCNEAFVIDRSTYMKLLADDPKSAEIIKPFLRGRDVKRWVVRDPNLWLIFAVKGTRIEEYPAVHKHLSQYRELLERRAGSQKWYELQASPAQTGRFESRKIITPAIENKNAFAFDDRGFFSNDKTSVIISSDHKYLLGVLNSKVTWWFMQRIASTKQGGFIEFKPMYISAIPIPLAAPHVKKEVESLVEKILQIKKDDAKESVALIEDQIDELVFEAFSLSQEERASFNKNL